MRTKYAHGPQNTKYQIKSAVQVFRHQVQQSLESQVAKTETAAADKCITSVQKVSLISLLSGDFNGLSRTQTMMLNIIISVSNT